MTDAHARGQRVRVRPGLIIFICVVAVAAVLTLVEARPFARHRADLSGYPTGVTAAGVNLASALTSNSNVPAAIMAAIPQVYGTDPTRPARSYTSAERMAAIQNDTPLGPYQLVYNHVYAFARAYQIQPLSFNEMADPGRSGNWLVGAAAAVIHRRGLTAEAVNFLAGTTDQPYFNPRTNNVEQRTMVQTAAGAAARTAARRNWVSILSALPIGGIGSRGANIFDAAFHWTVVGSLSQVCGGVPLTYANPSVIPVPGNWTNPVSSTKVAAGFDVLTHDGVDLATTSGAAVYAVTSGVVRLVGSNAAVAAAGGPRSLVLYTGNNLTFAYQDLATDVVADGQQVRVGQLLGTVASTPTDHGSSGPHLHFGVNTVHAYASNHATWVDPVAFMRARGVNLGTSGGSGVHVLRSPSTSVRTTEAATATQGLMDLWQGSQLSTAATLVSIGQRMRVPGWGIQIAVMTAMRGSRLGAELPASSGASQGVLALPASWGSASARGNLSTAAQMFYSRLLAVPNWQNVPPWEAAARTGAYASAAIEGHRAMWSGAGIIMNVLGTPGTTSTFGTEATVGGGCTGAPGSGAPTVNLSGGFRMASFNLHGCTASGTSGPDSCTGRFTPQWTYINQHGFSFVGLQELEPPVFQLLQARANAVGSHWAFYPTSPQYVHQQTTAVLWRTDQWQMLSGSAFQIPKYAWTDCSTGKPITHTTPANETQVLLRNAAGQKVWVISIHNISTMDAAANAQNCRPNPPNPTYAAYLSKLFPYMLSKDMGVESPAFADAYGTGIPVVLIGDFNDDTVLPICTIQKLAPSAHSIWDPIPAGGCAKPASTRGQPYEKIIGSGGIRFSGTVIDWSTQTSGMTYNGKTYGITDHGVPSTLATLP
ncbi:hypothetical protein Back2_03500 [Nocardioides baekrokdamisoli]|uniref:M23ase beta-sheet core domain-containing protein n=1 Tax=Nocardioides baekrokdamisoli TaxID=1804624 RepID=A0A3G9IUZ2_9ACTN|nr:M23 family metallopeptidase [Nocardioides baekrokdamisoli]BBH16063.1 hypothetical protein Back2_03500 [Nocardioides baekrokdamisoli]